MVKSTLILLQVLLAASAVFAGSPSTNDLIYIGQYDENNYYVSPNSAHWSSANVDCLNQLGAQGHLVAIETAAEWEFLRLALENYGFGTTFWTSGMYDPSRTAWRWTKNDQMFGSFAPWGTGFPGTPNQLLRVLIYYTNRYDAYWWTVPSTQLHRYICEVNYGG